MKKLKREQIVNIWILLEVSQTVHKTNSHTIVTSSSKDWFIPRIKYLDVDEMQ